jgi:hypothetical protein
MGFWQPDFCVCDGSAGRLKIFTGAWDDRIADLFDARPIRTAR